jgi:hypothetical protein
MNSTQTIGTEEEVLAVSLHGARLPRQVTSKTKALSMS